MIVLQKPFQRAKLVRLICKKRCLASLRTCFAIVMHEALINYTSCLFFSTWFLVATRGTCKGKAQPTLYLGCLPSRCSPPPAVLQVLSVKDSFLSYKSTPRCITGCVAEMSSGRRMKLSAAAPTSLQPGQQPRPQEHWDGLPQIAGKLY